MAAAPEYLNHTRRSALVVDDSRLACAVLSRLLEQEGFDIELAASAQEALERLRHTRPDVIFMDHLMPGVTGLDAVRALKSDARYAAIPVVMFSSQEDQEFLSAARAAGAVAVLTKHTERTNLGRILEQVDQCAAAPAVCAPVVAPRPVEPPRPANLTRADLRAEIEPMLCEQRDRIREELLAELAILENHQESMRRALTGRLEVVLRRTLREASEELAARFAPDPERSFLGLFARSALVAAALALLAVPIGLIVEQRQQLDVMAAGSSDLRAAVDSQSRALAVLGAQVEDLGRQAAASSASLQRVANAALQPATVAATARSGAGAPRPDAIPLAELLSASGIAGPIELRSDQGSFCLDLEGSGYRLTPVAPDGGRCAPADTRALVAQVTPAAGVDRAY